MAAEAGLSGMEKLGQHETVTFNNSFCMSPGVGENSRAVTTHLLPQ